MKKCDDIRGRLTLYLDNELQGEERATVAAHLSECESCAHFAREQFSKLSGRVDHDESPPAWRARVQEALNQRGAPARRGSRVNWVVAVAAALLILLLPVLAWRILRQTSTSPATTQPSNFALMAADTHLRHMRGQLPLEVESASPQAIYEWFSNQVNSRQLPNIRNHRAGHAYTL